MVIFYILFFLLLIQSIIIPQNNQQGKKIYLILAFIELQIVSGCRIPSAGDSEYYADLFVEVSSLPLSEALNNGLEKGFMLFLYMVSLINSKPQTIIFFSSLLLNSLVLVYIYKKSKLPWFSVVLYVTLMFFFNAMNLMRFVIAYSILLYSNDYIVQRKPIKFLTVLVIASTFHFSSILYGIVYCLYPMKLNLNNFIKVAAPLTLLSFFILPIFHVLIQINGRYTSYEEAGEFYQSAYANILEFGICFCVFLFFIYYRKRHIKDLNSSEKLYLWLAFLAMVFAFMSIKVMMIVRFVSMFSLIYIVCIANVISEMKLLKRQRWMILFLIVSFLKMFVILTYRSEWYFGEPYKNWLFGEI